MTLHPKELYMGVSLGFCVAVACCYLPFVAFGFCGFCGFQKGGYPTMDGL